MKIKEQAIQLRLQGISINKIAKQLNRAKSTISVWTRGVTLTQEQKISLDKREITDEQALAHSNIFRMRRQSYQNNGKVRIRQNDPLYIAGCMLYWGEGSKNINQCQMVNSELPMLLIFKSFLIKFFNLSEDKIQIRLSAYTDMRSKEEIEDYWIHGLGLPKSCLKKSTWNQYPISSKKKNVKKSEYGTCTIQVCDTKIVQEIFGAIQEFGGFINDNWLSK
ncbi:hypothetical protein UFOVP1290_392 [uncultured Caudovirales phage]|uniref:Uncharacterized protein n=1 Tax=uncultured Caudovirales phage TaxID=2100421 RepID=A0A6J5RLD8_9CAUD|nr:hypothetical protein UFOVP1290_392 [uncultured Caudovirales phage]